MARPIQPICPRCKKAPKKLGQTYCTPCGREYKRANYERLKTEPRKIIRACKPICPQCKVNLKHPGWPYCRPCMLAWRSARRTKPSNAEREAVQLELTPEVAGYVAGILDGEGCVTLSSRTREGKTPEALITVGNTDRRLILWLHERFGGFFRRLSPANERCKPHWHWNLSAINARRLLRAVRQHLIIKQRHADIVLAFHDALLARPFRRRLGVEPFPEPFASLYSELRALNRKGPPPTQA